MKRQENLKNWLSIHYPDQNFELNFAAADADFRRYFRATFDNGQTIICMDAPPEKMSIAPYIKVQKLFQMVNVPSILAYDEHLGFMALEDLGQITYLTALEHDSRPEVHKMLLLDAIDQLIELQKASLPNQLPEYDQALLEKELHLFPDWFVAKELNDTLTQTQSALWEQGINNLLPIILQQPKVYVHRDFIVRNLMLTQGKPGVLDFQDAVYGPITYDLVSLLKDAFIEWEEEFVLDLVVRYWEKARAAGLPVPADIDIFYKEFEFMGVQRHLKVAGIFARLFHRDGKDKYRAEIPRFLRYLKKTTFRYHELAPIYQLLNSLIDDGSHQTGYTF
ncbi:N-acetylmuramate/N-acetylglucosamine kinase AmgK [Neisseria sp. Ec49-e6-T10]|uniref:N-acetylmuramate/N-acetylglucosamine kinase AmgK n=1 Tax=Neisseria sp. Ec49-e6-T10 TaxID=3140744 RepID=UPI003EBA7918